MRTEIKVRVPPLSSWGIRNQYREAVAAADRRCSSLDCERETWAVVFPHRPDGEEEPYNACHVCLLVDLEQTPALQFWSVTKFECPKCGSHKWGMDIGGGLQNDVGYCKGNHGSCAFQWSRREDSKVMHFEQSRYDEVARRKPVFP